MEKTRIAGEGRIRWHKTKAGLASQEIQRGSFPLATSRFTIDFRRRRDGMVYLLFDYRRGQAWFFSLLQNAKDYAEQILAGTQPHPIWDALKEVIQGKKAHVETGEL